MKKPGRYPLFLGCATKLTGRSRDEVIESLDQTTNICCLFVRFERIDAGFAPLPSSRQEYHLPFVVYAFRLIVQ